MAKDYYASLGVSKSASQDEIKAAFRKAAHAHHPDKGGDEAKFKEANEAYQVLGDAEKRAKYDQFGSAAFDGSGGGPGAGFDFSQAFGGAGFDPSQFGDLGDLFGNMFGGGGRQQRGGKPHGQDLAVDLTLSFKESVFGVDKEIPLAKSYNCDRCGGVGAEPGTNMKKCNTCNGQGYTVTQQRTFFGTVQARTACSTCSGVGEVPEKPCTDCKGKGTTHARKTIRVSIPAGVEDGMQIRVRSQGEALGRGGEAGDLYLRVHVQDDPRFVRDGDTIFVKKDIGFTQAALGDEVEVETVDGKVTMKVPQGTQSGDELRLRGKGVVRGSGSHFAGASGDKRGDQIVVLRVVTPKKLSKEARAKLEELNLREE